MIGTLLRAFADRLLSIHLPLDVIAAEARALANTADDQDKELHARTIELAALNKQIATFDNFASFAIRVAGIESGSDEDGHKVTLGALVKEARALVTPEQEEEKP